MNKTLLSVLAASAFTLLSYSANVQATPIKNNQNTQTAGTKKIITYMLLNNQTSLDNLKAIAADPKKYNFTRLNLAFINPRLAFNGINLKGTGLFNTMTTPPSLKEIQSLIATIKASGKQIYLSVGGWDNSMGGDGDEAVSNEFNIPGFTEKPDSAYFNPKTGSDGGYLYFKTILLYPKGEFYPLDSSGKCRFSDAGETPSASNHWCHIVEPKSSSQESSSFPYPYNFPAGDLPDKTIKPDTASNNHYQELVKLSVALGVDGIDIDDEEFWSADWYRTDFSPSTRDTANNYDRNPKSAGPWLMPAAVDKFAWIVSSIEQNAAKNNLSVSMAAPAVGAIPINGGWGTGKQWWGGNLKGLVYNLAHYDKNGLNGKKLIADLKGGIGVMTYDLASDLPNPPFGATDYSPLDMQVATYMNSFKLELNGILPPSLLYPGVEIGNPAFPAYKPSAKLPLLKNNSKVLCGSGEHAYGGCDLNQVLDVKTLELPAVPSDFKDVSDYWQKTYNTNNFGGIILWEQFKKPAASNQASTDEVETYYSKNFK